MPFAKASIPIKPFSINHTEGEISSLKTLLKLSPLPKLSYENSPDRQGKLGLSLPWLQDTRDAWLEMDWQETQEKLNEYPQFLAEVPETDPKTGKSYTHTIHFVGIENAHPDAVPVVIMHGWPGCFVEILPLVPYLLTEPNPPLHIIIPSLVGTAYSSSAPLDRDFTTEDGARVLNNLMKGLGYGLGTAGSATGLKQKGGYYAQGGDIGAYLSRFMAVKYEDCLGAHFNFCPLGRSPNFLQTLLSYVALNDKEKAGLERTKWFAEDGRAYANEHATRPATIGAVLASSPTALLAWLGEKFIDWTDETPPTPHLLQWLSIYWLTQSFPTSIYHYRAEQGMDLTAPPGESAKDDGKPLTGLYIDKPIGFSWFPKELMPVPRAWIEKTGRFVQFGEHDVGGHFAATEQPELLAKDLFEYLRIASKQ